MPFIAIYTSYYLTGAELREWGLLGWFTSYWIIPPFPTFSTRKLFLFYPILFLELSTIDRIIGIIDIAIYTGQD